MTICIECKYCYKREYVSGITAFTTTAFTTLTDVEYLCKHLDVRLKSVTDRVTGKVSFLSKYDSERGRSPFPSCYYVNPEKEPCLLFEKLITMFHTRRKKNYLFRRIRLCIMVVLRKL